MIGIYIKALVVALGIVALIIMALFGKKHIDD